MEDVNNGQRYHILSLIIALLAVFFGPLVQIYIAQRQMKTTAQLTERQLQNALAVANRQIVSPIRQQWIDTMRSNVAELISTAQNHWIFPKDTDVVQTKLLLMDRKIELLLNPDEEDHQAMQKALSHLTNVVLRRKEDTPLGDFTGAFSDATAKAQAVLKREWERVKNE